MTREAKHSLWPSRIIVLATGLMVGFFLWRTYLGDAPRLYPVEFTQGQWLIAADEAPQGYFRHDLYIPGPILQAWVVVATTDSFILYVNGKAVDGKGYASLNVSGIYDIGQYLLPGKNVVGVVARRLSYPGPAMAVLEGSYRDQTGREHVFATDATWKVSSVEQTQGWGEIPWYAEAFDATAWKSAKAAHRPAPSEIYPLGVPAQAFAIPPHGQWIGPADYPMGQAAFTYTLTLPAMVEDAWMRLAAGTPYALAINGIAIGGAIHHAMWRSCGYYGSRAPHSGAITMAHRPISTASHRYCGPAPTVLRYPWVNTPPRSLASIWMALWCPMGKFGRLAGMPPGPSPARR